MGLFLGSLVTGAAQTYFSDRAEALGIHHLYGEGASGGGVSFCDFDGDGWDDLTMATEEGRPMAFYRNEEGTFTLLPPLISNLDQVKQVLWADIDNDGDKDLFITTLNAPNRLFENKGNLELVEITSDAGLSMAAVDSYGACIADFDRDGWLDIYVTQRNIFFDINRNFLYRNLGDGTFEEIATQMQADDPQKAPFFPAAFDLNNDNWPDIYIAQDKSQGNTLLLNNGPSQQFSDISVEASANLIMNAMGIAVGDYNCDGWQDLYVSNTPHGNALLQNNQMGAFWELAEATGTTFNGTGWGTHFFDADNDGFEDLYVSGMAVGTQIVSSAFYYNGREGYFSQEDAGFIGDTLSSYGNAIGDYNNDGLLDIAVVNTKEYAAQLWANEGELSSKWLKIMLEGVVSNRDAIGTRIDLYTSSHYQMRYKHAGMGYLGQNASKLHFGLEEEEIVDSLIITWPTGHIDRLYEVAPNQLIYLQEGSSTNGEINLEENLISEVETSPAHQDWTFFPNPATQQIYLNTPDLPAQARLHLFESTGKKLKTWQLSQKNQLIPVKDLPPGPYWLHLQTHTTNHPKLLIISP